MSIDIPQEHARLQRMVDRGEINQGAVYAIIEAHAINQGGSNWQDLMPAALRRKSIPSPDKKICPQCRTEHWGPISTCKNCYGY